MRYTFITCLTCFNFATSAQTVLSSAGSCPIIGDAATEVVAYYENPGSSGPNCFWDYPAPSVSPYAVPYNVISPSAASYASHFPNANLVVTYGFTGQRDFYKKTASALQLYGQTFNNQLSDALILTDPEDLFHFPFTYGDAYTDTWEGKRGSSTDSVYVKGSTSVVADGYGTLVLLQDTVPALRLLVTRMHTDSVYYGTSYHDTTISYSYYEWRIEGIRHYAVLENTDPGSYFQYIGNLHGILGVETLPLAGAELNVYPNPGKGIFNITFHTEARENISMAMYNSLGEHVKAFGPFSCNPGSNTIPVDTGELPAGLYMMKMTSGKKSSRIVKVLVE